MSNTYDPTDPTHAPSAYLVTPKEEADYNTAVINKLLTEPIIMATINHALRTVEMVAPAVTPFVRNAIMVAAVCGFAHGEGKTFGETRTTDEMRQAYIDAQRVLPKEEQIASMLEETQRTEVVDSMVAGAQEYDA